MKFDGFVKIIMKIHIVCIIHYMSRFKQGFWNTVLPTLHADMEAENVFVVASVIFMK